MDYKEPVTTNEKEVLFDNFMHKDQEEVSSFDIKLCDHFIEQIHENYSKESLLELLSMIMNISSMNEKEIKEFIYFIASRDLFSFLFNQLTELYTFIQDNHKDEEKILFLQSIKYIIQIYGEIFSIQINLDIFEHEIFNPDSLTFFLSLINDNICPEECFYFQTNLIHHRKDLFDNIDPQFIRKLIIEHICKESLIFCEAYLSYFNEAIPDFIDIYMANFSHFKKECISSLFCCSSCYKETISIILSTPEIFDISLYDNEELLNLYYQFISHLIRIGNSEEKSQIIYHLDLEKLNIKILNTILEYCNEEKGLVLEYCLQFPIFEIASDSSYKEKKEFIEHTSLLIKSGVKGMEEDFIRFSFDFLDAISNEANQYQNNKSILAILDTISFLVLTLDEPNQILSTIDEEFINIIIDLSHSDDADIEESANLLIQHIEDRKTEIDLNL